MGGRTRNGRLSGFLQRPAQKWISRGAALLHLFGYEEARLAFNEAVIADSSCGIAHCGVARTSYHPIWAPPSPDELTHGTEAILRAMASGAKTERERDYIGTLALFFKDWLTVDHATRATILHALQLVAIRLPRPQR